MNLIPVLLLRPPRSETPDLTVGRCCGPRRDLLHRGAVEVAAGQAGPVLEACAMSSGVPRPGGGLLDAGGTSAVLAETYAEAHAPVRAPATAAQCRAPATGTAMLLRRRAWGKLRIGRANTGARTDGGRFAATGFGGSHGSGQHAADGTAHGSAQRPHTPRDRGADGCGDAARAQMAGTLAA